MTLRADTNPSCLNAAHDAGLGSSLAQWHFIDSRLSRLPESDVNSIDVFTLVCERPSVVG